MKIGLCCRIADRRLRAQPVHVRFLVAIALDLEALARSGARTSDPIAAGSGAAR
jgi:hypothetical protein